MPEAKTAVEQLVDGREITIYVPMLEDPAAFEMELRELGVHAAKEAAAAE
jgi:hypothetical protein